MSVIALTEEQRNELLDKPDVRAAWSKLDDLLLGEIAGADQIAACAALVFAGIEAYRQQVAPMIAALVEERNHLAEVAARAPAQPALFNPDALHKMLAEVYENRGQYLRAFIDETGARPTECEFTETLDLRELVVRVRRRGAIPLMGAAWDVADRIAQLDPIRDHIQAILVEFLASEKVEDLTVARLVQAISIALRAEGW